MSITPASPTGNTPLIVCTEIEFCTTCENITIHFRVGNGLKDNKMGVHFDLFCEYLIMAGFEPAFVLYEPGTEDSNYQILAEVLHWSQEHQGEKLEFLASLLIKYAPEKISRLLIEVLKDNL